jgi:uncharacterized membrane protein YkoI
MQLDPKRTEGRIRGGRVTIVLCLLLCAGVPAAAADTAPSSLEEAVSQVERAHAGRLLSARVEPRDGQAVYVIRWLTEGQQVRTFEIPAAQKVRP